MFGHLAALVKPDCRREISDEAISLKDNKTVKICWYEGCVEGIWVGFGLNKNGSMGDGMYLRNMNRNNGFPVVVDITRMHRNKRHSHKKVSFSKKEDYMDGSMHIRTDEEGKVTCLVNLEGFESAVPEVEEDGFVHIVKDEDIELLPPRVMGWNEWLFGSRQEL